jgi:hypothetical protein
MGGGDHSERLTGEYKAKPLHPRRDTRAVAWPRLLIVGKAKSSCVCGGTGPASAARERGPSGDLSAGLGWAARRAAGGRVRPAAAAESTGRPPGFHWGPSNRTGAERDWAYNGSAAGWEWPYTGGSQITQERRGTRRSMRTGQAGSGHGGVGFQSWCGWRATLRSMGAWRAGSSHGDGAAKARWTGEQRGKHTRHGALGCSIHWRRSNHRGLESGAAWTGGVARWELPYTNNGQSCVVRGRLAGMQKPTLPLFNYLPNLIPPADIFEVKIWSSHGEHSSV